MEELWTVWGVSHRKTCTGYNTKLDQRESLNIPTYILACNFQTLFSKHYLLNTDQTQSLDPIKRRPKSRHSLLDM